MFIQQSTYSISLAILSHSSLQIWHFKDSTDSPPAFEVSESPKETMDLTGENLHGRIRLPAAIASMGKMDELLDLF
ncbi:hypothetical protein EYC80_003475 [Monilinia laxa]|uniref:Uncharacterized protein n=1 Tax=Monilinia laxa TaxID=61186 RepID=A0A5N6KDY6_MONLA|nr:hypothetical protein EYC80_003475 [Monilinia laxa]